MNKNPHQSRDDYAKNLFCPTGIVTSESTISRSFNHGFKIIGNFLKLNAILIDTLFPENIVNAEEFISFVIKQDIRNVKIW